MADGKLTHRGTWKAGAVTACAAALLSLALLPAAAQAGTRAAVSQRAEGVRVIGHKVIDGKAYKVIYVAGARPARAKAAPPTTLNSPTSPGTRAPCAATPESRRSASAATSSAGQRPGEPPRRPPSGSPAVPPRPRN